MTGPRNRETPWKSAATLEAELHQERAARVRAEEALRQLREVTLEEIQFARQYSPQEAHAYLEVRLAAVGVNTP